MSLNSLNLIYAYQNLAEDFYRLHLPQGLAKPKLIHSNHAVAQLLGIQDPATLAHSAEYLGICSGNQIIENSQPLAMKYAGHQFGSYNPDLGDGRALLLAQVQNNLGQYWDLHLKGSGLTAFSRSGDGKAVLRSSIREYLCGEAMHHLGVPTTRALALVSGTDPVQREVVETAATVLRVAQSHIRFGHFEHHFYRDQVDHLASLVDHVIQLYRPKLAKQEQPVLALFNDCVERTAQLIAKWQALGFCHGVMNTDNMSILGLTIDYGPFAFMDDYEPGFICNHSDYTGRYAFDKQPSIGEWNLTALAYALSPLIDKTDLEMALQRYQPLLQQAYANQMRAKLGLTGDAIEDIELVNDSLSLLEHNRLDYTRFWRRLSDLVRYGSNDELRSECIDIVAFDQWTHRYLARLAQQNTPLLEVAEQMDRVNPKYILRNYLLQQTIEACEQGDNDLLNSLFKVLQNPFDDQPEFNDYAKAPPEWGKRMEISCSS